MAKTIRGIESTIHFLRKSYEEPIFPNFDDKIGAIKNEIAVLEGQYKEIMPTRMASRYCHILKCFVGNLEKCILGSNYISKKDIHIELSNICNSAIVKFIFDGMQVSLHLSKDIVKVKDTLNSSQNSQELLNLLDVNKIVATCTEFAEICTDRYLSYTTIVTKGIDLYLLQNRIKDLKHTLKKYQNLQSLLKNNIADYFKLRKAHTYFWNKSVVPNRLISYTERSILSYIGRLRDLINVANPTHNIITMSIEGNTVTYEVCTKIKKRHLYSLTINLDVDTPAVVECKVKKLCSACDISEDIIAEFKYLHTRSFHRILTQLHKEKVTLEYIKQLQDEQRQEENEYLKFMRKQIEDLLQEESYEEESHKVS